MEADVLHPKDRILAVERGATTQLTKEGVYDFNADLQVVRVYEGKAIGGHGFYAHGPVTRGSITRSAPLAMRSGGGFARLGGSFGGGGFHGGGGGGHR